MLQFHLAPQEEKRQIQEFEQKWSPIYTVMVEKGREDAKRLASIYVSWDRDGNIQLRFESPFQMDDYQREDGLAVSVPLVVSHQLGTLRVEKALALVSQLLDYLESDQHSVGPINPALKSARLDLLKGKAASVFLTFHPNIRTLALFGFGDVEEAVRRMLVNYATHVPRIVSGDFPKRIKDALVASVLYFLEHVVTKELKNESLDRTRPNPNVHRQMIEYSLCVYRMWESTLLPEERFAVALQRCKELHQIVCMNLGVII